MALYGDTSGRLSGHQKAGDQNLTLDALIGGSAYGDANQCPVMLMAAAIR